MPTSKSLHTLLVIAVTTATATTYAADLPAGADAAWVETVTADFQAGRYEAAPSRADALAANPAQGYALRFSPDGLVVTSLPDAEATFMWSMTLASFGREARADARGPGRVVIEGARVERRAAGITEWYVNRDAGLEHGFTVSEAPLGEGRLAIELHVGGDLTPRAAEGRFEFLRADGEAVIRYDTLHVFDADGRELPSEMTGDGETIRLLADDRGARYPVTIDPLIDNPAWEVEGDATNGFFSFSVATAGDVNNDGFADVIVGAPAFSGAGRVKIFHGSATGLSTSPATTLIGFAGQWFGYSVGTAGDLNGDGYADVIVGAPQGTVGTVVKGEIWTYFGSPTGIDPGSLLVLAPGKSSDADAGYSVAPAGDVNGDGFCDIVVGAPRDELNQTREGLAYVFHGGTSPSAAPATTLEGTNDYARFGHSVATAGDVDADGFADIIIGAPYFDGPSIDEGLAAIHHGSSSGVSTTAEWTKESNYAGALFGISVSTAGDVNGDGYSDVIVGALGDFFGLGPGGNAFVYHGSFASASQAPAWSHHETTLGARYGEAVGTAGDVNGDGFADVVVGAPGFRAGGATAGPEGKVFAYHGSKAGLSTDPAFKRTHFEFDTEFGNAVGTAGDVNGDGLSDVIFGAHHFSNGQSLEGRAQVHHGSIEGLQVTPAITKEGDGAGARAGSAVSSAGDVNGDGFGDWIVGAPLFDSGGGAAGRAMVWHGNSNLSTATSTPAWTFDGQKLAGEFGFAVSEAGDVNGDGYSDVIVGAPKATNLQFQEGQIFLFHGSKTGLSTTASTALPGSHLGQQSGFSVACAGDVNADGFLDILWGAPYYKISPESPKEVGRAYAKYGSSQGISPSPFVDWLAEGDQEGGHLGYSVAGAGDLNGDGFSDVVIGAPNQNFNNGAAYWYLGSANGLADDPASTVVGILSGGQLGFSVAGVGDFNGDTYSDTVIGAPYSGGDWGTAYVYRGGAGGTVSQFGSPVSGLPGGLLGYSVAAAGDVDGDSLADVLVGEPGNGSPGVLRGLRGSSTDVNVWWSVFAPQSGAGFARAVAFAGDVDGDGYADAVVGAPSYDGDLANEGAAYVFPGNVPAARSARPRQRRLSNGATIDRLGESPAWGVQLELLARSPLGRGRVAIEWELQKSPPQVGTSFGGTGYMDSGQAGTTVSTAVTGLADASYSWRARAVYDPTSSPFLRRGPWVSIPWNGTREADFRIDSVPSTVALDSTAAIDVQHLLGTAPPAAAQRSISNAGGLPLNWAVTANPAATWLTVTPATGFVGVGDPAKTVTIGFDPSKLPAGFEVGEFATTLRFQNSDVPGDFKEIPIKLTAAHTQFVPGDLLKGQLAGVGDQLDATFTGFKGMKLVLKFGGATQKQKLQVRMQSGNSVQTSTVKVIPGKTTKLTLKVKADGLTGFSILSQKGGGPLDVKTSRKLHKSATASTKTLSFQSSTAKVRALPGATLSGKFTPAPGFLGPILQVQGPSGASLDLTGFQQLAGKKILLNGLPLPKVGTYSISIQGWNNKKQTVKAALTPVQPPPGNATVILP